MEKDTKKIIVAPVTGKPSKLKQAAPDSEIYKRGWTVGFFKPSKESTKQATVQKKKPEKRLSLIHI